MDLSGYADMDPAMLYSVLNMRLRDRHADLDDLARFHDIDRLALETHMAGLGYRYDRQLRQFRAAG
jgi:hypothetical protein